MEAVLTNSPQELRWFAVWTRSRQEKSAAAILDSLQVPHFLPLTTQERVWSDRKKSVQLPLFEGYFFVRIDLAKETRLQVLKTPGIVGLVGNQNGPVSIPDQQIEGIRTILSQPTPCIVGDSFVAGMRVRVVRGPFTGVTGILTRTHSSDRLVISLEIIQKSLSVNVSRSDVILDDGPEE